MYIPTLMILIKLKFYVILIEMRLSSKIIFITSEKYFINKKNRVLTLSL